MKNQKIMRCNSKQKLLNMVKRKMTRTKFGNILFKHVFTSLELSLKRAPQISLWDGACKEFKSDKIFSLLVNYT